MKQLSTVAIAMSGGVDSSVAASLLVEQGHHCLGIFFVTTTTPLPGAVACPWEQDAYDARQVCAQLGIPLYVFNFEEEYRTQVLDYFYTEYARGRTPNPDIVCNREIKFGLFWQKAQAIGADYIATGHYAQIKQGPSGYGLYKSVDQRKDQSYFLYTLRQADLEHTVFPIGGMTKSAVRRYAQNHTLWTAAKKDSQGLCFIGPITLTTFLEQKIPAQPGPIIDTAGAVIGQHHGAAFVTIGQRHGLALGGSGAPYYVVAKDVVTNTITVTRGKTDPRLYSQQMIIGSLSWVTVQAAVPYQCQAKIRYRQPDQSVTFNQMPNGNLQVDFAEPQWAAAEGQSIVFYDGEKLLGGGVIKQVLR